MDVRSTDVATNLDVPWDIEWWAEDTILFTEHSGAIKRLDLANSQIDLLYEVSDLAEESQSGLMGLQPHPNWPDSNFWFAAYTYFEGNDIELRVVRLTYNRASDQLENERIIVDGLPSSSSNTGCRLLIDSDQMLFVTLGDLKLNDDAQDINKLNGKILRYNLDGSIPASNPFSNSPIYSYGHRNPQGIVQTDNGNIFISEHGPSSNDEVNRLVNGGNYGWPLLLGPCTSETQDVCDSLSARDPIEYWSPTIAPCGIAYYGDGSIPELKNSLIVAALKAKQLSILSLDAAQENLVETRTIKMEHQGRLRDVLATPSGRLFIATSNNDVFGTPSEVDDRIIELDPYEVNSIDDANNEIDFSMTQETIRFEKPFSGQIALYDLSGQLVYDRSFDNVSQVERPKPNTQSIFSLVITNDKSVTTHKFFNP